MDGKGEVFARNEAEQIIHPYLDDSRYYDEQWISARYLAGKNDEPELLSILFLHRLIGMKHTNKEWKTF